jgi:hypothetical protein
MAADGPYTQRLAELTASAPRAAADASGRERAERGAGGDLTIEVVPALLGRGTMLRGADALIATARPPHAWVHPDDAQRVGIDDGAHVVLRGTGGHLELPVQITDRVAQGCVRIPGNALDVPVGVLSDPDAEAGAPLRARLEAAVTADA